MKLLPILLLPLYLLANTLFNLQEFYESNYGSFVLSKDKKSFYSLNPFSLYQIKQIDINTTKVITKYQRYKDIDLETPKEKLVKKLFPKLYKSSDFRYDIDDKKHIIYYANKLNQIIAYDYKLKKNLFKSKTLLVVKKYSKIQAIRVLKDSSKLLLGIDNTLVIFDTKSKLTDKPFGKVDMQLSALDISPNFKYIVASGIRGDLKIYDYKSLKPLKKLQVESHSFKESFHIDISTIQFVDDDKFLYASSLEGVQLASVSSGKVIRNYTEKKSSPRIGIRKNKAYFITYSANIYKYDLKKGRFIEVYKIPLQNIKRIQSDKKQTLMLSSKDGDFIYYNLLTNRYKNYHLSLREHFSASFAIHPTKLQFARVSSNHAVQIFDVKSKKEVFRVEDKVFDMADIFDFLDDDTIIYSSNYCGFDKKPPLVLIDTKHKRYKFIKGHLDTIVSYEISNDKKYLITSSEDRTIKLWRLNLKNSTLKELDTLYMGERGYGIRLSDDEKSLAVSTFGGDLYIYGIDLQKGKFTKLIKLLEGKAPRYKKQRKRTDNELFDTGFHILHTRYMNLRFFDNDTKFICEDKQANIIVYDIKSGKKLYKLLFFNQRDWVKLYPNGKFESSKYGYKYIDDKFYDIFKKDEKVLEDITTQEYIESVKTKQDKKEEKKSHSSNGHMKLQFVFGFLMFIAIMMIIPQVKKERDKK